ncbi:MAG TPA: hypothetical protein VIM58_11055 [Candidatus Methylacidiphilales bacterium]
MSEGIDTPGAAIVPQQTHPEPQAPVSSSPAVVALGRIAPPGGRGGLWFWGGLCAVLAAAAFFFHSRAAKQDQANREAQEQLQLFVADNQKLRAEVDRLQTELAREGTLLRNREQVLRETTESLQQVQAQADQAAKDADARAQRVEALRTALDKAIPNDPDIQVVAFSKETPPRVVIRLGSGLLFDPGLVVLNDKGKALLKTVADALAAQKPAGTLSVECHLDSTPLKTMSAADMTGRRASEAAIFISQADPALAAAKPIAAQGFADSRPLVSNDGPDHAKNRRLEVVLTVGE